MKKSTLLFVSCVVAFIVGVFFLQQQVNRRYDWSLSFSTTDPNPFGTLLFDSLMEKTLPKGYRVENTSLKEYISAHKKVTNEQLLCVEHYYGCTDSQIDSILRFVERGNTVVIANCGPSEFGDTLNFALGLGNSEFTLERMQKSLREFEAQPYDTLVYDGASDYKENTFRVFHSLVPCAVYDTDSRTTENVISLHSKTPLDYDYAVATKTHFGKGTLYIVTMPYLFTNYGVMDEGCRNLMLRFMNELAEHPVVHVHKEQVVEKVAEQGFAPLSFLRRHAPLLFAWRLLLLGAVLLLVINSRRRRRALPLRAEEPNTTVSYLRQLSRLYRKRSDHSPLVHKRYRHFADYMMRRYHLDVQDEDRAVRSHVVKAVAQLTGRSKHDVELDFDELGRLHETIPPVSLAMFAHAVKLIERLTPGE